MEGSFIGTIVLWIIGLVILYFVIYTAVKDGINKSLVGQVLEKKYDVKEEKKSFLDNDLDSD
ncbi:hypothetical protein BN988_02159 [Oceanobacillus picturae]|uniref:Uncharacterized protein n=1 Tax=Oceanobacillus picturae TaxID=171693 RepID=W9ALW6_9BACI|nr:hypothetical protein [Oceanobacillus picturae]CDO03641.1 hypothetical protein BN988_02159 [Oceanobacillus picturae]